MSTFGSSPLRQVLIVLVCLKIAGLILAFDPLGLHPFDLPKSLYSRAFAWLLGGVLVAVIVQYGHAIIPRTGLNLAAGGVLLAYALAALFAENRYIALFGESERYLGLSSVADFFVLYVAVAVAFRSAADWAQLVVTVAAATVIASAYAAAQYLGLDPVPWSDDPRTRPFGTVGNPNQFAHYLSVAFGAAAALAVFARPRAQMLGTALVAVVTALIASLVAARATVAAIGLMVPLLLSLRVWSSERRRRAVLVSVGVVAVLTVVAVAAAPLVVDTPLGGRALGTSTSEPSVLGRVMLARSAAEAFRDRPLLGVGPDNLGVVYPRYRQGGSASVLSPGARQDSAHNFVMQAAATAGLAGVLAWLAFLAAYGSGALRRTRGGAAMPAAVLLAGVAYWSHALVSPGTVAVDWVPWVGLGALAAVTAPTRLTHAPRARSTVTAPLAGLAMAAGMAAAMSGWSAFAANRDARTAIHLATSNPAAAATAALAATANDPGRAEYWNALGIVREAAADLGLAEVAYGNAATTAPYEWRYVANIARVRQRRAEMTRAEDDIASAMDAAQRAVEIDPREPLAQRALAETAVALMQFDVALGALERAVSLYPIDSYDGLGLAVARRASDIEATRRLVVDLLTRRQNATTHLALAEIALRQGDRATARVQAQRVLALSPQSADARRILAATGP